MLSNWNFSVKPKASNSQAISILQVVNKIVTINTKTLYESMKVYMNQGGANWSFMITKVNLLFYITGRNPPNKT